MRGATQGSSDDASQWCYSAGCLANDQKYTDLARAWTSEGLDLSLNSKIGVAAGVSRAFCTRLQQSALGSRIGKDRSVREVRRENRHNQLSRYLHRNLRIHDFQQNANPAGIVHMVKDSELIGEWACQYAPW